MKETLQNPQALILAAVVALLTNGGQAVFQGERVDTTASIWKAQYQEKRDDLRACQKRRDLCVEALVRCDAATGAQFLGARAPTPDEAMEHLP